MSRFPAAFRPPAFASRSSDSRRGIGPSSRSAYRPKAGPRRGYRVPHARATTGVGAPSTPRTAVLIPAKSSPWPAPAASRRPVPAPRYNIPPSGALLHEASTRVQAIHPSGLPLACSPRMERAPLGFPPSFEPRRQITDDARRGGARPSSTGLEQRSRHQPNLQSTCSLICVRPRVARRRAGVSHDAALACAIRAKRKPGGCPQGRRAAFLCLCRAWLRFRRAQWRCCVSSRLSHKRVCPAWLRAFLHGAELHRESP